MHKIVTKITQTRSRRLALLALGISLTSASIALTVCVLLPVNAALGASWLAFSTATTVTALT